ncbi:MAG: hypothetical protein IJH40_01230 [Ruminococcus sp.]|uniref:hypothetical protein n=1 Tax=Ruminococcus sp. TaxID=41978 RepID=UPI002872E6B1|nr:hypothetical protein [Ruminococcus sp.]MBQ3284237.1 hypothetical protein [Ruminococcus sp.]
MKRFLSIILTAALLLSVFAALPLTAQAATVTRIDEFRFAINPNRIALKGDLTAGEWLNNLKNSANGVGTGVSAAADAEGWKVDSIVGIHDDTSNRYLKDHEYPDMSHDNWLRVKVSVTDPENYVFNGNKSHSYDTYVNGVLQSKCPLNAYDQIDIRLFSYAKIANVPFYVPQPILGDQCSNYAPTVDTMPFSLATRIQIKSYQWCIVDPYTHWPEECTTFSDSSADYALLVEFTTDDGYYFGCHEGTVTVNGEGIVSSQYGDGEKTVTEFKYHVTPKAAYTVSGTVTSFLSDTDSIMIGLGKEGSLDYLTIAAGNSASYSIPNVIEGTYTMAVSKKNHTTRTYEITVSGNTTQDVKICPKGDADNNGRVNAADAKAAFQQGNEQNLITDPYKLACADVASPKNRVNSADAKAIFQHANEQKSLWSD